MVKTHVRQLLGDAKTKVRSNDVLLRKKKTKKKTLRVLLNQSKWTGDPDPPSCGRSKRPLFAASEFDMSVTTRQTNSLLSDTIIGGGQFIATKQVPSHVCPLRFQVVQQQLERD